MKKILLVCYGGGHVKIIAPIYLSLNGVYDITILALTTAGAYLKERNIPYTSFADYKELLNEDVLKYGDDLQRELPFSIVDRNETIAYLGLSFNELIGTAGSYNAAKHLLETKGRSAFLPINTLKHIIQCIKPDLVITTNVARAELAALHAAKELNISSICINDNLWIEGGAKNVAYNDLCSVLCVLTKEVKDDILKKTNFPSDRVKITGTPVFDIIKSLTKNKLTNVKPTILFADCDLPEYNPRFPDGKGDPNFGSAIRKELDRLAKKNNWEVVFRPHPNQDYDYKKYKNIKTSLANEDLHTLLLSVDIVVTAISTVGIEGKLLGSGLVSLEGTVYQAAGSYAELGISTGVTSDCQLNGAIHKELDRVSGVEDELYPGNSIDNINKIINLLLDK